MNTLRDSSPDPRQSFCAWLDNFDAVSDENALLAELVDCWDMLPPRFCDDLGLPQGSKYRDAVALLLTRWTIDAFAYPN